MDRLAALLERFSLSARVFHSGPLCGTHEFPEEPGLGQLHLVRHGRVRVVHAGEAAREIEGPALLFYPRPLAHRFETDAVIGAQMVCARVRIGRGEADPFARALPGFVAMPLDELEDTGVLLDALFDEAFRPRCGGRVVIDRLFEVIVIRILRALMARGDVASGLLAGLADPQLSRALIAIHERPSHPWTLESLAQTAGLSRSLFAERFRGRIGSTPAHYLAAWRLGLAEEALRRGEPLKRVAQAVGYGSESALSRAFRTHTGRSPRQARREGAAG